MEVVFLEDPCCSWCWAYQPVDTAFAFEFGDHLRPRRLMAGLRDYPIADVNFAIRQWNMAERVSGMPFEPEVWKKHLLQTTFIACISVKAAALARPSLEDRFLRRLREALFVEQHPIDDFERILPLAEEVGLDVDRFQEHISSGRAESLFQRERSEASKYGFGYPTTLIRSPHEEKPIILQGVVPYSDLTKALSEMGFSLKRRKRFRDRPRDWERLFRLRPRLTVTELTLLTELSPSALEKRLRQVGARRDGPFYCLEVSQSGSQAKKTKVAV